MSFKPGELYLFDGHELRFVVSVGSEKKSTTPDLKTMRVEFLCEHRIFFRSFLEKYDDEIIATAYKRIE